MRYLIFEYQYGGHFIEYIRHLIDYAKDNIKEDSFYFVVPNNYKKHLDNHEFNSADNIQFIFMSEEERIKCQNKDSYFNIFKAFSRCRIIRHYINLLNIQKLILLTSINYVFGLQFLPSHVSINAIEYIIPLRRDVVSWRTKISDKLKMRLYAHNSRLKNLFLLNDEESAKIYNNIYRTQKFKFLPDPIDCMVSATEDNLHHNKITLLHAGRFRKEKGTFDIINAMKLLPDAIRQKFKLVICGCSPIKIDNTKVIEEVAELKKIMDVEFYNSFVSPEFLHSQYNRADIILIPYRNFAQSSGNLGHAASYGKPVIGPGQGLLGHIIRKYKLGYCLGTLSPESIATTLSEIKPESKEYGFKAYADLCSPRLFSHLLLAK